MDLFERGSKLVEALRVTARCAADVPKLLPSSRSSPGILVREWARKQPNAPALAFESERFTWRDVSDRSNRYAAWFLDHGVEKGDVVALVMDNRPDFIFVITALSKIGSAASLINTNLTGTALAHAINICEPKLVLAGSEHVEKVTEILGDLETVDAERDVYVQLERGAVAPERLPAINEAVESAPIAEQGRDHEPRARDLFCYIYTSGTTGLPKAAIITNQRMLSANVMFGHLMHRSGPGDVIYVALPLYHSTAMFLGWGSALATGCSVALRRKFSVSNFWKDVREFRATSFLYIGEICRYLLNAEPTGDDRDHQIRVATGNGMAPAIWEEFQERFRIPVIREFYGATEGIAPLVNLSGKPGMVGKMGVGQALLEHADAQPVGARRADQGKIVLLQEVEHRHRALVLNLGRAARHGLLVQRDIDDASLGRHWRLRSAG